MYVGTGSDNSSLVSYSPPSSTVLNRYSQDQGVVILFILVLLVAIFIFAWNKTTDVEFRLINICL